MTLLDERTSPRSTPELLLHDCMYMSSTSVWAPSVAAGVLLATFSASLNNLIGDGGGGK